MATSSKNTVSLLVETGVTGQAEITELGQNLRGVGDAARASTPEIDRMGRKLEALAELQALRATVRELVELADAPQPSPSAGMVVSSLQGIARRVQARLEKLR